MEAPFPNYHIRAEMQVSTSETCSQEQQHSKREDSQLYDNSIQFLVQVVNFHHVLTAASSSFEKGEVGHSNAWMHHLLIERGRSNLSTPDVWIHT